MSRRLGRRFYARPAPEVAPELLNKVLVGPGVAARIVEVEAYCGTDDPGSHAYRGPTPRTEVMHGLPGHLYVYFSYGMHWCANVVTDGPGTAGAVLLRAATPLRGLELMHQRRGPAASRPDHLCSGPAKLAQAFGLNGEHDGTDLVTSPQGFSIRDNGTPPPARPGRTTRVGLSKGADLPYRWFVPGVADVSRHR
ncbi:MAG: DNA-3-methyladenine glycosylase [Actinobacteria bacterium]|nr:DNA-3-methyladenine glycosylase [Actinomycetota bacterium]NIY08590.1 DNA-3-methyladenine glycosylase [Gemmatimonadota bacterium]NIS30858.1 DNA-3-methyladenine glycosylase [Actinomycetota bacterium]NIT95329.1 DNA-3-methyladenine glycosylase [Actinomycetota bacterium]NIU19008.1 DNA-3-methyladenine glycosylase [Actinomycetota bacterium]